MIPLRLTLRNFMCYREPPEPLSFEGLHVACLCGPNGHGKSAILDAITWALWGECRADSADDLIHLGQTDMEVALDFQVGGDRYRVIRKRSKSRPGRRAGVTLLDLHVMSNGTPRSIGGNTVAETQRKIIDLLRLDYTTFTNSAYLAQGRADEFTRQPPAQRKEVLADILGLAHYDTLAERARDRARQREADARAREATLSQIDAEMTQRPAHEAEAQQARDALAAAEAAAQQAQARVTALHAQVSSLQARQGQAEDARRRRRQAQDEEARAARDAAERSRRIAAYDELLARQDAIERGYHELVDIRSAIEALARTRQQHDALEKDRIRLEGQVEAARQKLLAEHQQAERDIARLGPKAEAMPRLEGQAAQVRQQIAALQASEKELNAQREEAQTAAEQAARLQQENVQLKREMQELKEKIDRLEGQARCPICGTELGADRCAHIVQDYAAQGLQKKDHFRANEEQAAQLSQRLAALKRDIAQAEGKLAQEQQARYGRLAALQRDIEEGKRAADELAQALARLGDARQRLEAGDFAAEERRRLAQVAQARDALGYDPARHEAAQHRLDEMSPFEEQHRRLEEACQRLAEERAALQQAQEAAARWRAEGEAAAKAQADLEQELSLLPQLDQQLQKAQADYAEADRRRKDALSRLSAAQERLKRLDELAARREQEAQEMHAAQKEHTAYAELAEAFGKKGVQALLIETALPEIEAEANHLLGRMTDGRMSLSLETQREKKSGKGEAIETLDIRISDELGTRSYETFSGGEAFRINVALRIALSRLLARRAGAPLPTLFLDEGFGTQDAAGREKLVEVINAIADDFRLILVITHIDEMKEMFPARIEVQKTPEGSRWWLS
ncbi:MAG: SMC family ATPase [Chloroflexi bacterium]|nr:SMC family ATPase [Chloroflexota bacterium]